MKEIGGKEEREKGVIRGPGGGKVEGKTEGRTRRGKGGGQKEEVDKFRQMKIGKVALDRKGKGRTEERKVD